VASNGNTVDQNIFSNVGDFQFDKNVAENFDSHVRKSVPFYDEIQRMVLEMSDWFIHSNSIVYDLGVSVGETLHNLALKHGITKAPQFIGIDNSEEMLSKARYHLAPHSNIILYKHDLNNSIEIRNASFVTMLYTFQFVRPETRQRLINDIYSGLLDNGALIIVEKIVGNNPKFNEIWIELYNDLKLRNKLTLENIKAKSDSLRGILQSYSQEKIIGMLEKAGFQDIDIFFKWYNFLGIVAVK
jgi:tRNA (cmo5U34)-methyltransferase